MYRLPSRRTKKHEATRPNLIPILDAVFIFIFFLLMSANFIKIFEISSNVPIVSDSPPPKNKKKPLALTIEIRKNGINIFTGVPSVLVKRVRKIGQKSYDLGTLHDYLIRLKRKNVRERTIVIEPKFDVEYEILVEVMDAVRMLRNTDPALFRKDKGGIDIKVQELFDDIVFGNIKS